MNVRGLLCLCCVISVNTALVFITPESKILLAKLMVEELVENSSNFVETRYSLYHSIQHAAVPYPKPN